MPLWSLLRRLTTGNGRRSHLRPLMGRSGRVIAYLFLPKKGHPPFQTVVYFPGSGTIDIRSSGTLQPEPTFDFIIKGGRAVIFPVYKGTFERGDDLKSDCPNTTSSYRDHVIAWSKDLGRSIDYLETRPEIDRNRLAYQGTSWGGAMGSLLPAVEDRIKCAHRTRIQSTKVITGGRRAQLRPASEGPSPDV